MSETSTFCPKTTTTTKKKL